MTKKKLDDKFYGTKPLDQFLSNYYPSTLELKHHEDIHWLNDERDFFYKATDGVPLDNSPKILFGIKGKEEKLIKFDFLWSPDGGSPFVVHKRVLDKFQEMCPDDFQAFPVIIKNLNEKDKPFANKDFHFINILNLVDVIDKEKTEINYSKNGMPKIKNVHFKENCMNGHLLARDKLSSARIIFDPKLAREFVKSKGVQFLSDEELRIRHLS